MKDNEQLLKGKVRRPASETNRGETRGFGSRKGPRSCHRNCVGVLSLYPGCHCPCEECLHGLCNLELEPTWAKQRLYEHSSDARANSIARIWALPPISLIHRRSQKKQCPSYRLGDFKTNPNYIVCDNILW